MFCILGAGLSWSLSLVSGRVLPHTQGFFHFKQQLQLQERFKLNPHPIPSVLGFGHLSPCRGPKSSGRLYKLFLSVFSNDLLLASLSEATSLLTFSPEEYSSNIEVTMSTERSKSSALGLRLSFRPTWMVDAQPPPPCLCSCSFLHQGGPHLFSPMESYTLWNVASFVRSPCCGLCSNRLNIWTLQLDCSGAKPVSSVHGCHLAQVTLLP